MKLYFSPGACSLAAHIALRETGLPFATERVDLAKKVTATGADFRAINPKGCVPALGLDNGVVLTEVSAILQYIADQAPEAQLAPSAGTLEHYRLLEWLNYIATELHKNFGPMFTPGASDALKQASLSALAPRFGYVARMLEGRAHLVGAHYTVADAYLFTVASWAAHVGFDLSEWPLLQAYLARVAARPAVQQTLRDEGLLQ